MLKYFLAFVPLIGTSTGSFWGTVDNFYNRFGKQEDTLVAVATGILSSITLNLFFEAAENIRYISLFIGIAIGFLFTFVMNFFAKKNNSTAKSKLFWAMLIHNIPEGILTGISLTDGAVFPSTVSLITSITLQNIPDGLVVSIPLVAEKGKKRALFMGVLSGVIEPVASILIIITAGRLSNIQMIEPALIGFSLSAILMVAIELFKECKSKKIVVVVAIISTVFNCILG